MPPKSTQLRLEHFDESCYVADSSTILYKFLDVLCGDAGAGSLKKEIFLQRLSGAISGIYGSDLDYIFGNMRYLSRAPSESYTYNPMTDMLTSDQWDEVFTKDAWFRSRITDFFRACCAGGTFDGIRYAVHSACSVDCTVFEVWRYIDNFGITDPLGRAPAPARNEVVVKPHKGFLEPKEKRLLRDMLDKITPQDTIATIDVNGLNVAAPVPIRAIAADSTYFEVQKMVTATPMLEQLPPPELLAIDLVPSEAWLWRATSPELAPYGCFNISQEYGYFYLASGGARSPIDAVTYNVMHPDGSMNAEANFALYETTGQYTEWQEYELADSPDNFPGGKFGIHPGYAPAQYADQSPYQFQYPSQADFVAAKKADVLALGGHADDIRYQLPIEKASHTRRVYTPDLAIAYNPPAKDSTVTSSWTCRKPREVVHEMRNTSIFVRS